MQLCILLPRRMPKNAASGRMVFAPAIPHAAPHESVQKSAIPFITFYCSTIIELYHLALLARSSLFTSVNGSVSAPSRESEIREHYLIFGYMQCITLTVMLACVMRAGDDYR